MFIKLVSSVFLPNGSVNLPVNSMWSPLPKRRRPSDAPGRVKERNMKRRKRLLEERAKELPRLHLALTFQLEEERAAFQTRVSIAECPIIVCVCVCVCVYVSHRSKGVRDNRRRFTHISKKKITTAAVGPFIS